MSSGEHEWFSGYFRSSDMRTWHPQENLIRFTGMQFLSSQWYTYRHLLLNDQSMQAQSTRFQGEFTFVGSLNNLPKVIKDMSFLISK